MYVWSPFLKQNMTFLPKQFRQASKAIDALCITNLSLSFGGLGFLLLLFLVCSFFSIMYLYVYMYMHIYGQIIAGLQISFLVYMDTKKFGC